VISKQFIATFLAMVTLASLVGGCAPTLDPQDYGQVLPVIPHVKGTERPFPLPELDKQDENKPAEEN
jgi:hypothetical protein